MQFCDRSSKAVSDAGDGNKRRPVVLLWMKLELQSVISLADCVSVDLEHFEMATFILAYTGRKQQRNTLI